jgi:septal ring factor EnvC (AmiA/AmiB activator)
VTQCQSEVATRKRQQQEHRNQIQKTGQIKSEISVLDKHASSTTSNVAESQRELQKIKQNLDTCSALLKERSLEVQTNSGFLERFLGKTYQRKREFMRQKSLLQNVSDALDRIHTEMPALLPSSDTKLLSSSTWNAKAQPLVDIREPIPELCYSY